MKKCKDALNFIVKLLNCYKYAMLQFIFRKGKIKIINKMTK